MSSGKAVIQSPAPAFTATAVVNGDFQEVSLSDYAGKREVFMKLYLFNNILQTSLIMLILCRKICPSLFLSFGFHVRVPNRNYRI